MPTQGEIAKLLREGRLIRCTSDEYPRIRSYVVNTYNRITSISTMGEHDPEAVWAKTVLDQLDKEYRK